MEIDLIQNINGKINLLIAKYESVVAANAELSEKNSVLEREIKDKNETIKKLQERIDILQLTSAFENSSQDRNQAKRKISGLIREIDNCIELLND